MLSGDFGSRIVYADRNGAFTARVPLTEGSNALAVKAFDLLGKEAAIKGTLQTRDTRGPTFRGGVEYGN